MAKFKRKHGEAWRRVEYFSDDYYLVSWKTPNEQAFRNIKDFVKSLSGSTFFSSSKKWKVAVTEENTQRLRSHGFRFIGKSYFISRGIDPYKDVKKLTPPLDTSITKEMLDPRLRPYQVEGVQMLSGLGGVGLLSDPMGAGKSAQISSYLKVLNKFPILIICPAGLKEMWARELIQWANIDSYICEGMYPEQDIPEKQAYIIGYNLLDTWANVLFSIGRFKIMVVDECQYLIDPKSIRSSRVIQFAREIPRFIAISGTPMKSKARQFWTVLNILDPATFNDEQAFLEFFCDPQSTYFGVEYNGTSNADILHKMISPYMIRRDESVILPELPPINRICVPLCLTNAKKYSKIEESLTDGNGEPLDDEAAKELYSELFNYKADAVIEWIDLWLEQHPGEKIVIAAYHLDALGILYDKYKSISLMVDGGVTGNKRQKIIDMFQEDDKHRIIFLQILTAVGYTLTRAKSIAIVELWYIPGDLDQTLARVRRLTSNGAQTYAYFLIGSKTIEERKIAKVLDERQSDVSEVLDGKSKKFFRGNT